MKISSSAVSVLPLMFVAWNDSVLSPTELNLLRKFLSDFQHLDENDKNYLLQYTDFNNPPDEQTLRSWLDLIKNNISNLSKEKKNSISEFITEVASVSTEKAYVHENENFIHSVTELTNAIGLNETKTINALYEELGLIDEEKVKTEFSFDPHKLSYILEGFGHHIKAELNTLFKDMVFDKSEARDKSILREHTLKIIKELAKRGYGALAYPQEYGGKSSFDLYIKVFEVLCTYDMNYAVKFGVQFGLFGGSLFNLGTKKHHDKYLKDIGTANLLGCFAMTETGHGSNVKDIETTATYDHSSGNITIHSPSKSAGKEYIGNALHGSLAVVFAQLLVKEVNHGVHAVLVPYRDREGSTLPGIQVTDSGYKLGLNGVDNGRIWFNQVVVPKENLLNRFGDIDAEGNYTSQISNSNKRFFTMLSSLVGGRICVGTGALEASKVALSIAIKHALKRRQFRADEFHKETLIMDYPSHQHRLLPLLVKSIVYKNAMNALSLQYIAMDENSARKIETKAAGLKAIATWHTTKTIQECREACGGKGYLWENHLADLKADSDIFTTFEGDNTVLMQLVAKGLLTEFQQSFNDDGFMATMRYLGGKIGFTLSELNIYKTRSTSKDHILDDDTLADALRYREKKMLITLSDRMRTLIKNKTSPHDAFLMCQVHMIDYARSYIERLAYREMINTINKLADSPEKEILKKINKFYVLSLLMEHRYFYLESDYMDGSKTKAIRRIYSEEMKEIRNNVDTIIDSFGFHTDKISIKE